MVRFAHQNPLTATFAVFGMGVAIGALVGTSLADSPALRRRQLSVSLGERVLNSVTESLPENLKRHLQI